MATPKKPRVSPTLATLPPTLLRRVLGNVASDDCLVHLGEDGFKLNVEELRKLSPVSRAWHAIATEAAGERLLRVVYVPFKPQEHQPRQRRRAKKERKRSEMLALRHQLILRRARTERLVIDVPPDCGTIGVGVWAAALSHAPKLKTLELATATSMYIEEPPTDRLVDLVRAATRHCPALEKLAISQQLRPPKQEQNPGDGKYMHALLEAVYDGLKVWSAHHGGLRDLKLPLHNITQDTEAYMDKIITYCPQIRTYRLSMVPRYVNNMMVCHYQGEDAWKLELPTWERFCQSCNQLEELDWRNVPFATHFFEVFGNNPKPKLRSLTLTASEHWVWDKFFRVVDTTTQTTVKTTGFGASAKRPESVLCATPNLEELTIEWPDSYMRDAPPAMDPAVFGDDFIEVVTRTCKCLRRLTLTMTPSTHPTSTFNFTDRSMRALARLPHLEHVHVARASITGEGLFELVANHTAGTRQRREYSFSIGETEEGVVSTIFYDVLERFLEQLAAHDAPLPCEPRPMSLSLDNRNTSKLEPGQSNAYLSKVRHFAEQVRSRHPSLQLRGIVYDYDAETGAMKRMSEFQVATESVDLATLKHPLFNPDIVDEPIDDAFVHRIFPRYLTYNSDSDSDA